MIPKPKRIKNLKLRESYRHKDCAACGRSGCDPSHIKTVKSGGDDVPWNIFPKCRGCHTEWGQIGPQRFCEKYPHFEKLLIDNGWEWLNGKLFHRRNE